MTGPLRLSASQLALMVVGVVGVSMSGPLMAAAAVPALAMSFWRNALGVVALAPLAAGRQRPQLRALSRADLRLICFGGLVLALHFATWTIALKLTSVASATALVCMQSAWVVLITWVRGISVGRTVVLGIVLALVGVLVVSGVDLNVSGRALLGDGLALGGGVFGAVYVIVGARVRETVSTTAYTFVLYAVCAGVLLIACVVSGAELVDFAGVDWLRIVAVTVAAQLLGHSVFNHLLATISPTVVSLTILLEVPGAALIAGVFLGQTPPLGAYVGLALILVGLAIVVGLRRETPDVAPID